MSCAFCKYLFLRSHLIENDHSCFHFSIRNIHEEIRIENELMSHNSNFSECPAKYLFIFSFGWGVLFYTMMVTNCFIKYRPVEFHEKVNYPSVSLEVNYPGSALSIKAAT